MTYEHNENINKVRVVILKINYGTKNTIANNFLEGFKKQTKRGIKTISELKERLFEIIESQE